MNPVPSHMLLMRLPASRIFQSRRCAKRKSAYYGFLLSDLLTWLAQGVEELDRDVWTGRDTSMMSVRGRPSLFAKFLVCHSSRA